MDAPACRASDAPPTPQAHVPLLVGDMQHVDLLRLGLPNEVARVEPGDGWIRWGGLLVDPTHPSMTYKANPDSGSQTHSLTRPRSTPWSRPPRAWAVFVWVESWMGWNRNGMYTVFGTYGQMYMGANRYTPCARWSPGTRRRRRRPWRPRPCGRRCAWRGSSGRRGPRRPTPPPGSCPSTPPCPVHRVYVCVMVVVVVVVSCACMREE